MLGKGLSKFLSLPMRNLDLRWPAAASNGGKPPPSFIVLNEERGGS